MLREAVTDKVPSEDRPTVAWQELFALEASNQHRYPRSRIAVTILMISLC